MNVPFRHSNRYNPEADFYDLILYGCVFMTGQEELIHLQMLLMDQQRSLESLSEQLIAQSERILILERNLELLQSKVVLFDESAKQKPSTAHEKPPHY